MPNASESLRTFTTRSIVTGCGSCVYTYNSEDGCYQRKLIGCRDGCTCDPLICGLTSAIIQLIYPESVTTGVPVSWSCSSGSDEQGNAYVLFGLMTRLAAAVTFWKRVAAGLGIVSVLLVVGLVFALLR